MDFNQLELRRETIFKDAVLSAAEAKSVGIISGAQQAANAELTKAQAACKEADHDAITARLAMDAEREHSAAMQAVRKELLEHRSEMVAQLFGEVEEKLKAFAQSKAYPQWLKAKLEQCAEKACKAGKNGKAGKGNKAGKGEKAGEGLTVYLGPQDMAHAALAQKALPGAEVKADASITLGGPKVSDGHLLYDLSLDAALADEKENFTQTSGLTM